jgi:hypothetical protein
MKVDPFTKLLNFLERLGNAKIPYVLSHHLEGAVSVEVHAPGEHWEVDFFADGQVYVERFRSHGHIDDESVLGELFALCSDDEPPTVPAVPVSNPDDAVARK